MPRQLTHEGVRAPIAAPDVRERLRWLLYPGINLHARLRHRLLPAFFGAASQGRQRHVLDAGCGNGMLAYQAYRKGNRVTAVSIKPNEVRSCRRQFNEVLGIAPEWMSFSLANLYEVDFPSESFDEVICTEVLEHIQRDEEVCRTFWRLLKPGGILHLTTPNADHPDNRATDLDLHETGGHVRPGYTRATCETLIEPIGFRIEEVRGIGGAVRQAFNRRIKRRQQRAGAMAGLPLFFLSLPFLPLDRLRPNAEPVSIYVRARKTGPMLAHHVSETRSQ